MQRGNEKRASLTDAESRILLATIASGSKRISRVELAGRAVWIKRFRNPGLSTGRRLQALLARVFPSAMFLRPSPLVSASQAADREIRQINAFRNAGFMAPEVLLADRSAIVLSDLGPSIYRKVRDLRGDETGGADDLLVAAARGLGEAHAAGLCHGRPHPRDFVLVDGRLGFLDFEEEPTAVMPLATAQARDIWLLFFQIAALARQPGTRSRALEAWLAVAPLDAARELEKILDFLRGLLPMARLLQKFRRSGDLKRAIGGTGFLADALPDAAREAKAERPAKAKQE